VTSGFEVKVRAAVLRAPGKPMRVEVICLRDLGPRDVRVRIDATGVCHSDLSLARGKLAQPVPAVLGHEAAGTVVAVGGKVDAAMVGTRVVLLWITPCGQCFYCLNGQRHLCANGSARAAEPYALDADGGPVYPGLSVGSFAEQTVVPVDAVVPVPDGIQMHHAALLGCAVSTGAGAALKAAKVTPGSSALVLGLGGVGLSAIMGARIAGAKTIIAVDRNPEKRQTAEAVGATDFLEPGDELKAGVRKLTGGRGVDFAFDCVGSAATIRDAWSLARRGGSACIVGIGGKEETVSFNALELFHFARTLVGCVGGSVDVSRELGIFYDLIRTGQLDLEPLITGRARLGDVDAVFGELERGRSVRTILEPSAGN
jgi:S-(hydroxymethyl)glutathione dehydrogenase/alcohol dehydrogenase